MILSRVRLLPQIRYDLEFFIAQQSGVRTDNKFYTKRFMSSENYIIKGFTVGGIGLNQATIEMDEATLIYPENTSDFSWYTAEDSPDDILISDADLTDGAKNYVEMSIITETNTPVTAAFWDPAANSGEGAEFTQEVDTMTDLSVAVDVRTGGFSGDPDKIPLAIVEVNGSGTIVGILDKRKLFFRLGQPGDEDRSFTWASQEEPTISLTLSTVSGTFEEGETVTFTGGATATVAVGGTTAIQVRLPDSDSYAVGDTVTGSDSGATGTLDQYQEAFAGADKDIDDFKEVIDSIQTEIKSFKGTRFWYQVASGSIEGLYDAINNQIVSNTTTAKWTWSGSELSLTDDSGTPADADVLAKLLILGRNQTIEYTRQDIASATIPIADGEVLFVELPDSGDRTYTGVGSSDTNFQTVAIEDYERNDSTYWLAVRSGTRLYLRGYGEFEAGETAQVGDPVTQQTLSYIGAVDETDGDPNYSSTNIVTQGTDLTSAVGELDSAIGSSISQSNQDRNSKLVEGGTFSVVDNAGTLELTLSEDAYAQIGGISKARNTISAQTISFPNATSAAYIDITRDDGPAIVKSVTVADNSAISLGDNTFIFARRVDDGILIGNSFLLKPGEFLELDAALAEINRYFGQLRLIPHESDTNKVRITGADVDKLSGSKLRLSLRNLLLTFDGAVIDFSTGEVFEDDGATPLNGGANDFTPETIPASEYFYYSVNLLANTADPTNEISGQILVLGATGSNAVLASAPKAAFANGIALGQVYVQEDTGSIAAITFDNIIQLGVGGSGSGGTGDANSDLESYINRLNRGPFDNLTPNIASIDEDGLLDGSSTATFDIANSTFNFSNIGNELVTLQLFNAEFLASGIDVDTVELVAKWLSDTEVDDSATYEVSRDGGNNYQTITMARNGLTEEYRGFHKFEDEPSNSFVQEQAIETTVFDLTDVAGGQEDKSDLITISNSAIIKKLQYFVNKNNADAIGQLCVQVIADDGGSPSTDPDDIIFTSDPIIIDDLVVGDNTIDLDVRFVLPAGDYHIVATTNQAYKDNYTADNTDKISVRVDGSDNARYRIEGLELDLRIRITSGTADVDLRSFGVFYNADQRVAFQDFVNQLEVVDSFIMRNDAGQLVRLSLSASNEFQFEVI